MSVISASLNRLRLAIMRLLQQIAIGWVLRFTPSSDVETIRAISALIDATDVDAKKSD